MHIMLDLETWGTRPGAAIRSVGACVFDPMTGDIGSTFYRNITDASCEAMGLVKDASTVRWWGEQSFASQQAFNTDQRPLSEVLIAFNQWWKGSGGQYVYGHGANFDPVILEAAFEAVMLEAPWKFWNVRCCRTILAMGSRRVQRNKTDVHHNALDDATAQARAVAAAFRSGTFNPG